MPDLTLDYVPGTPAHEAKTGVMSAGQKVTFGWTVPESATNNAGNCTITCQSDNNDEFTVELDGKNFSGKPGSSITTDSGHWTFGTEKGRTSMPPGTTHVGSVTARWGGYGVTVKLNAR
jgi:hypothetical protein